jgi:hypothetical protein
VYVAELGKLAYRRHAAGRRKVEVDQSDVRAIQLGGSDELTEIGRLADREVAFARQKIANSRAEDREAIGDQDLGAPQLATSSFSPFASASLSTLGRAV